MNENQITLTSVNDMLIYAQNLNASLAFCASILKSGLVPSSFKTPEAVYVAVLYGKELGFTPMQSLTSIYVINNKPALEVSGIKALIAAKGGTITPLNWDESECTIEMTRPGWKPQTFTYTAEMAKKQGLLGKDNWNKHPLAMVYARCVSVLARNMWADLLKGFYSKEEMEDTVIEIPNPIENNVKIIDIIKAKEAKEAKAEVVSGPSHEEQIQHMVSAFKDIGITSKQIETLVQKPIFELDSENLKNLRRIFLEIKKSPGKAKEYFVEE